MKRRSSVPLVVFRCGIQKPKDFRGLLINESNPRSNPEVNSTYNKRKLKPKGFWGLIINELNPEVNNTYSVYLHDYCSSSIYYFINFTFAPFFFLSSPCTTNSVTFPLLSFFFLRCTQTHPHTNNSTQTNQHRDT